MLTAHPFPCLSGEPSKEGVDSVIAVLGEVQAEVNSTPTN
jgi:hypothetical protein